MTVLPTSYFPPIPWMIAAVCAENPVIDIHEHYLKQTIRNRCTIITANGLMHLVIPVKKYRNHTAVKDIHIDHSTDWQRVHTNAIRSAYGKSAYFEFYGESILKLYEWKAETLFEWNAACLSAVFAAMKVNPVIGMSGEYIETGSAAKDLRNGEFDAIETRKYMQVFEERHGFVPGLSVLDLIFCEGPEAGHNLRTV